MPIIDVDAHLVEGPDTWSHIASEDQAFAPQFLQNAAGQPVLVIDGFIRRGGNRKVFTADRAKEIGIPESRNIMIKEGAAGENVAARISDMDGFGVDVQVLQPTLFLQPYSDNAETQIALCKAYANWVIHIIGKNGHRLRWAVPLPLLSIRDSLELMNRAHDHGAVSVFIRPIEGDRPVYDPYFDPIYREASKLNMAVGIHVGMGNSAVERMMLKHNGFGGGFLAYVQPVMSAFHGIVTSGLPKRFPNLRFAFLEASAQWLPWVMRELSRRENWKTLPPNLMEEYRLYVACFTSDDLSYIMEDPAVGSNNIVLGTDYGHADVATEVEAMKNLSQDKRLPDGAAARILGENAARLYGFN